MRQRYRVLQRDGQHAWDIFDNQTDEVVDGRSTRREARAECQRLNASEVLARADQQQSREETI